MKTKVINGIKRYGWVVFLVAGFLAGCGGGSDTSDDLSEKSFDVSTRAVSTTSWVYNGSHLVNQSLLGLGLFDETLAMNSVALKLKLGATKKTYAIKFFNTNLGTKSSVCDSTGCWLSLTKSDLMKVPLPVNAQQSSSALLIDGTEMIKYNPNQIWNWQDLQGIRNYKNGNFEQKANITLPASVAMSSDPAKRTFFSLALENGVFDGKNLTINNLYMDEKGGFCITFAQQYALNYCWVGLFNKVTNSEIRNVNLRNVVMSGTTSGRPLFMGGVAGEVLRSKITNVGVTSIKIHVPSFRDPKKYPNGYLGLLYPLSIGGLIGHAESSFIVNSYSSDAILTSVNKTYQQQQNIPTLNYGYGDGIDRAHFGGLLGDAVATTITQSYSVGTLISAMGQDIGGLVGRLDFVGNSVVSRSYALSPTLTAVSNIDNNVSTSRFVGGLFGAFRNTGGSYCRVEGSFTKNAKIYGTTKDVRFSGGLLGASMCSEDRITDSFVINPSIELKSVTESNAQEMGGLAGRLTGGISRSYVVGFNASASVDILGGVVGHFSQSPSGTARIEQVYSQGASMRGGRDVGGLVGLLGTNSRRTGPVTPAVKNSYVLDVVNIDSSTHGTPYQRQYASAGFVAGRLTYPRFGHQLYVENVYAARINRFNSNLWGACFIGIYYAETIIPLSSYVETFTDVNRTALCDAQPAKLKQQSTYVGWDFNTVWAIDPNKNGGYPYLRALASSVK
jgi:hypothetical protein